MIRHALNSFGLSTLFLAGLVSMLSMPACVASSEDGSCALRGDDVSEGGAGEGACDDEESDAEGEDEEAPAEEAPAEERAASPRAPVITPQAMCSPICDRI
ncbi:hypothetical protein BE17_47985 [Sorangium cellulosum]|uniref:Secreted protein n=1 Tax=Sorangium cellulosum TaxID=56 RepID=A0A150QY31_SORCE|nr:hypothetical protein BE17_47985 [Sorangium cellulosum]